jgi:hypothetical protein
MEAKIGINQRIPMQSLEDALLAIMNGTYNDEYAIELAKRDYEGENRLKKAMHAMNKMTRNSSLLPFIMNNVKKISVALKSHDDRAMVLISLVNVAYGFCYDVTAALGKYFHAQKLVSSKLIQTKLSEKYGTNRTLPNGLYCILPMLVDAGFIERQKVGVYKMCQLSPSTEIAVELYRKSFLLNNPLLDEHYPIENNFYFEFIDK